MNRLTANEAASIAEEVRKHYLPKALQRAYKEIRKAAERGHTGTAVRVRPVVCVNELSRALQDNGFEVSYPEPDYIWVYWGEVRRNG